MEILQPLWAALSSVSSLSLNKLYCVQTEFHVYQLVLTAFCPVSEHYQEEPVLTPLFTHTVKIPQHECYLLLATQSQLSQLLLT